MKIGPLAPLPPYPSQHNVFKSNAIKPPTTDHHQPPSTFNFYFILFLVTNMQALGEPLEKKQPWQKHCSNLHHWHLRPYPFRYSICSGRATVAQFFYIFTHTHTFLTLFFFLHLIKLSVVSGNSIRLELSWDDCSCRSACDDRTWTGKFTDTPIPNIMKHIFPKGWAIGYY